MRALILLSFLSGLVLSTPAPARAETFDLDVYAYCTSMDACGQGTYWVFKQYVLDAIEEVNLEWAPTGITFRPNAIFIPWPNSDYEFARCQDDLDTEDVNEVALFEQWKVEIASKQKGRISILLNWVPGGDGRTCCSELPINGGLPSTTYFGILCDLNRSAYDLGTVLAHELGHHFCLCHTFGFSRGSETFLDREDWNFLNDGDLDWSGDDDGWCGVYDTDPDPAWQEKWDWNSDDNPPSYGLDRDQFGLRDDHQWCSASNVAAQVPLDKGSPHATHCAMGCQERVNDVTYAWSPPGGVARAAQNTMGYWGADCRGPYVRGGQVHRPFTKGQKNRVHWCYQNYRKSYLPDACLWRGGDADGDGICQADDKCKAVFDTHDADADHDGIGDVCDLQKYEPGSAPDIDLDGVTLFVDQDDDGDGCRDSVDQHPAQGMMLVGTVYASSCGYGTKGKYLFEGQDSDSDGFLDCRDVDDDDDGWCDEGGPLGPGAPGSLVPGCQLHPQGKDPCPVDPGLTCFASGPNITCPPDWIVCNGIQCGEFVLKLFPVGDPNPEPITFDTFQQFEGAFYVAPLPGQTASQTARTLAGQFDAAGLDRADGSLLRLEIWSRGRGGPDQFAALVAEYPASEVDVGALGPGGIARFVLPTDPDQPLALSDTTFGFGVGAATVLADEDGDGWPDAYDNCVALPNPRQGDADGDGFGNRCDADLDGDRLVTATDVARVAGCEGADLLAHAPLIEPAGLGGRVYPPNPCDGYPFEVCPYNLARGCVTADLDEDGLVGAADVAFAEAARGMPPGPSAYAPRTLPCDAGRCDDGDPCTEDRCEAEGCVHLGSVCDDSDLCTVDACEAGTGACFHDAVACDDGDACTIDACVPATGECAASPSDEALACSDGDPCTLDACDPANGQCVFEGSTCDDGNPCTLDACEGRTGVCGYTAADDGTLCSDGDRCTTVDRCTAGACLGLAPVVCDDGLACTSDHCAPATGACEFVTDLCDDGNLCTVDSCTPDGQTCTHDPLRAEEPDGLRLVDALTLEWNPAAGAAHANTYRGTIGASGFARYDHVCYESADLAGDGPARSRDASTPALGTAFYYAVSGEIRCDESAAGFDSAARPRPTAQPCLTPP